MRAGALITIIVCELLILMLLSVEIGSNSLSLVSTLVAVVVTAFAFSALLRNFNGIKPSRNYLISGIIGVIVGIVYFIWASDNLEAMVSWLKEYGVDFLLLIILLCALVLFFFRGGKKSSA